MEKLVSLVEFTNTENYSVAIYNYKTNTIKYYKLNDQDQYEEVNA